MKREHKTTKLSRQRELYKNVCCQHCGKHAIMTDEERMDKLLDNLISIKEPKGNDYGAYHHYKHSIYYAKQRVIKMFRDKKV